MIKKYKCPLCGKLMEDKNGSQLKVKKILHYRDHYEKNEKELLEIEKESEKNLIKKSDWIYNK